MRYKVNDTTLKIDKVPGIYTLGGKSSSGKSYLAHLLKAAKIYGYNVCVIDQKNQEALFDPNAELICIDRFDFIKSKELKEFIANNKTAVILIDNKHDNEIGRLSEPARINLGVDYVKVL